MMNQEELEFYIDANYINTELVDKGRVYKNQPDLRPVKQGVTPKILNDRVLVAYTRKEYKALNDPRIIPVIGKLLLINEARDSIYLVDEYNSNRNNKISIPGGHLDPSDLFYEAQRLHCTPKFDYLFSEINREIYEELRFGYENYDKLDDKDKPLLIKSLEEIGIDVIKEYPIHYLYIDCNDDNYSSFAFYLPMVVNMDKCKLFNAIVPYSKDDHSYLKSLLNSKDGKKIAIKEFDMAKKDIRIGAIELLNAIFNTSHLIL